MENPSEIARTAAGKVVRAAVEVEEVAAVAESKQQQVFQKEQKQEQKQEWQ